MKSVVLLLQLMLSFVSAKEINYIDFYNSLSYEEQQFVIENKITNYDELQNTIYSYISVGSNGEYDHSKAYPSALACLHEHYPGFEWVLSYKKSTKDVTGHEPINMLSDLFPLSDITEISHNDPLIFFDYPGCGLIAMMGILDYFSRYLGYDNIMNNPYEKEDRQLMARELMRGAIAIELPIVDETLMLPGSYSFAFNNYMRNCGIRKNIYCNDNFKVTAGEHDDCWEDVVNSINNGIPATLMTGLHSGKGEFAEHYTNICGYEVWRGHNALTGEIVEKRLIFGRINLRDYSGIFYCDADILKDGTIATITYDMRFDNESNIYASDFAGSFVNDNGDGQYFFDNRYKTVLTANGDTLYTNRKRCSYIENKYLVMSPNRANAGEAYLFITFAHNVDKLIFNASLWSKNENIQNQIFEIQYYTDDCKWKTACVVDLTKLTHIKDVGDKITVLFPKGTHQIRFYTKHFSPSGSRNKGRIVLDKIKIYYN